MVVVNSCGSKDVVWLEYHVQLSCYENKGTLLQFPCCNYSFIISSNFKCDQVPFEQYDLKCRPY